MDINLGDGFIEIKDIDVDWTWTDDFPNYPDGLPVDWITFSAGQDGDKLALLETDANGESYFPPQAILAQGPPIFIPYGGARLKIFLDFSAGTFNSAASSMIIKFAGPFSAV